MMDVLSRLVEALRCLPGVGPKSAQRMAYYLLQHQRPRGLHLAACLNEAMHQIRNCVQCHNYTVEDYCAFCLDTSRDQTLLCVVESPSDIAAIEQSHAFTGYYYVLMNLISPLDGIGPEDINLSKLKALIEQNHIQEIILALSPGIEGQTTSHFIQELVSPYPTRVTQLACGIPSGGELEFLDGNTISNALKNRANLADSLK